MDAPSWLDPTEMWAWRALVSTHGRLFARLDDELVAAHGLSLAEYEVLVQLSEAPGAALRMAELAERALVSRSGLTRRVDGMVSAGLVRRQACPSDRRGTLAVLTDAGRGLLARAAPTHLAGVRRHLVDLVGRSELEALGAILSRVVGELGDGSCGLGRVAGGDGRPGGSCGSRAPGASGAPGGAGARGGSGARRGSGG
ncbi:MAG: MarR family winged helix-turn-helix transcriptional regulator [Acidimicrobiales bacterium]